MTALHVAAEPDLAQALAASLRFRVVCKPGSTPEGGWNVRDTATGRLRLPNWRMSRTTATGICALANGNPGVHDSNYVF